MSLFPTVALVCLVSPQTSATTTAAAALSQISQRFKVALVVEGSPEVIPASAIDIEAPDAKTALRRFGDQVGYDVQEFRGTFALRRRYERALPEELPAISVDELRASLKDIRRIADAFPLPTNPLLIDLATFLTEAKGPLLDRLQAGPIPFWELPEKWYTRFTYHFYGEYLFKIQWELTSNSGLLDSWPEAKVVALMDAQGRYRVTLKYGEETRKVILPDSTISYALRDPFAESIGLKEAVVLLSKTSSSVVEVEPVLAKKPIWVTGHTFVRGESGIQALAQLCGLKIRRLPEKRIMERNRPIMSAQIWDAGEAIRTTLPDSLVRYLQSTSATEERLSSLVSNSATTTRNLLLGMEKKGFPSPINVPSTSESLRLFLDLYPLRPTLQHCLQPHPLLQFPPNELLFDLQLKNMDGKRSAELNLRDAKRGTSLAQIALTNIK